MVTRGIDLSDLVGRTLRIGTEVVLFAHRATAPCMYLEGLLQQKGLFNAIYGDAGLCCEIEQGGVISDDDAVEVLPGNAVLDRCQTWPCKALFVRPSERTAADREAVLACRAALKEGASMPGATSGARRRMRLFDQAFGRRNEKWDGGMPQW